VGLVAPQFLGEAQSLINLTCTAPRHSQLTRPMTMAVGAAVTMTRK
jgi:hypothetical protein